ncbi:MAG: DNA alkylation repair protein [Candidatus Bathyarchaeota archaeon]|nr:MAG: DNA alkylation repair protein [Candidatus Bathyarchaeota archaeon]
MESAIVEEIRSALQTNANPVEKRKRILWAKHYQEQPKLYGIPTPTVRRISSIFFQNIRYRPKTDIFQLCNDLLESGYSEERTIAFDWAFRLRRWYTLSDFLLLKAWLTMHVHSWGACDDLCTHALGAIIYQIPTLVQEAEKWTKSSSRWVRRASAVCLIYSVRRKKYLEAVLRTADALLADSDIMVQKGYGWMLKEASNHYPKRIFNYVLENTNEMPRTALRYAIEKLPPELRRKAMERS